MRGAVVVVPRDRPADVAVRSDRDNQIMAVQALPENDDVIRHMFGDLAVKGGDSEPYEWRILRHRHAGWYPPAFRHGAYRGMVQQDVQYGDWLVPYVSSLTRRYDPETFEAEYSIVGPAEKSRVSQAINPDHLPPKSEWQKPNIDNLPPRSEWPKLYWKENE